MNFSSLFCCWGRILYACKSPPSPASCFGISCQVSLHHLLQVDLEGAKRTDSLQLKSFRVRKKRVTWEEDDIITRVSLGSSSGLSYTRHHRPRHLMMEKVGDLVFKEKARNNSSFPKLALLSMKEREREREKLVSSPASRGKNNCTQ